MKTSLILRLFVDSRDLLFHEKYGQTTEFAPALNFHDVNVPAKVQPLGNVECTCYACEYVAQTKTKKEYDIDELFSRIPHTSLGADPRTVLGEVVKNGFLIKGTTTYDKPFSSYWRADTGNFDAFDNVRSAITLSQSPLVIWSNWYREWLNIAPNAPMPIGKNVISSHMYATDGWATVSQVVNVGDEPMLLIEWWDGQVNLMPRDTFNAAMSSWGCGAAVLSTNEIDVKRIRTLTQTLIDYLQNLVILLKSQLLFMKNR